MSPSITSGKFITFEGGEGSGKSTQIGLLSGALAKAELPHIATREPGGTTGAESIRRLLVEGEADEWDPMTETILFMAARIDHVRKRILPTLDRAEHVLCDRFMDSTLVYQGIGKGLGIPFIDMLHRFTLGTLKPDLTLILDVPPEEGLKRAGNRRGTETRFEGMDMAFHQRIRQGFLNIAAEQPERCAVVDATREVSAVLADVRAIVRERLALTI